jgi:hypothetical protein
LKAGSSVRMVLDLAGCTNILSKIMWSPNKLNNALATVEALWSFKVGKFPERAKKKEEETTISESEEEVNAVEKTKEEKNPVAKKAPVKKAAPKKDA